MNKERQIQLLYPPLFLLAALCAAMLLDSSMVARMASNFPADGGGAIGWEKFVGIVAAGGVVIIVTGFLIGTVSIVLLRLFFRLAGHSTYEAVLPAGCLDRIWPKLGTTKKLDAELTLFATATFDHELLPKPIHEWLLRRWNSFNICVRSCVSLVLALLVVVLTSIQPNCGWYIAVIAIIGFFAFQATLAWRETMTMIDFQSYRELSSAGKADAETSGTMPKDKSEDKQEKDDSSN